MNDLVRFFSFQDPVVFNVVLGSILVGLTSSSVGCFTLLQRRALIGDAVSHSILPGICVAFILQGDKDPVGIIIGSFIAGWISLLLLELLKKYTKLSEDTVIGLMLSFFFAVGVVLLTAIQHMEGVGNQSGLDSFIFGSIISINQNDLIAFSILGIVILATISVFYKEIKLVTFDEDFARSLGIPVFAFKLLTTTLGVLAVVAGIQAVGVVLMAAMLITPAAAARFWTNRLSFMMVLACAFGIFSAISGAYISYLHPSPTGPWIVMILSMLAIISFLFAPKKGVVDRILRVRQFRRQILRENILKTFYKVGERDQNFSREITTPELLETEQFLSPELVSGLKQLQAKKLLLKTKNGYLLTSKGIDKGRRVTKLHRLWEVYISEHLNLPQDHIHEDAEKMEHVITPEVEKQLEKVLKYPEYDPHHSKIPYSNE